MFHWIADKFSGSHQAPSVVKDRILSPTFLLEQSVAYSAFLSSQGKNGEWISFEEFLRRKNLTES